MFRTVKDLLDVWERESAKTQQILDVLNDASLSRPVMEKHRTLGRVAWHIVTTIPEMLDKTGLSIQSISPDAPLPEVATGIQQAYKAAAAELLEQVRSQWTDQTLMVEDDMYGEKWPRGFTARVLIDHQIHHRGQLTVLMRQAGLKVPGIYGPSLEDWGAFGIEPPEI